MKLSSMPCASSPHALSSLESEHLTLSAQRQGDERHRRKQCGKGRERGCDDQPSSPSLHHSTLCEPRSSCLFPSSLPQLSVTNNPSKQENNANTTLNSIPTTNSTFSSHTGANAMEELPPFPSLLSPASLSQPHLADDIHTSHNHRSPPQLFPSPAMTTTATTATPMTTKHPIIHASPPHFPQPLPTFPLCLVGSSVNHQAHSHHRHNQAAKKEAEVVVVEEGEEEEEKERESKQHESEPQTIGASPRKGVVVTELSAAASAAALAQRLTLSSSSAFLSSSATAHATTTTEASRRTSWFGSPLNSSEAFTSSPHPPPLAEPKMVAAAVGGGSVGCGGGSKTETFASLPLATNTNETNKLLRPAIEVMSNETEKGSAEGDADVHVNEKGMGGRAGDGEKDGGDTRAAHSRQKLNISVERNETIGFFMEKERKDDTIHQRRREGGSNANEGSSAAATNTHATVSTAHPLGGGGGGGVSRREVRNAIIAPTATCTTPSSPPPLYPYAAIASATMRPTHRSTPLPSSSFPFSPSSYREHNNNSNTIIPAAAGMPTAPSPFPRSVCTTATFNNASHASRLAMRGGAAAAAVVATHKENDYGDGDEDTYVLATEGSSDAFNTNNSSSLLNAVMAVTAARGTPSENNSIAGVCGKGTPRPPTPSTTVATTPTFISQPHDDHHHHYSSSYSNKKNTTTIRHANFLPNQNRNQFHSADDLSNNSPSATPTRHRSLRHQHATSNNMPPQWGSTISQNNNINNTNQSSSSSNPFNHDNSTQHHHCRDQHDAGEEEGAVASAAPYRSASVCSLSNAAALLPGGGFNSSRGGGGGCRGSSLFGPPCPIRGALPFQQRGSESGSLPLCEAASRSGSILVARGRGWSQSSAGGGGEAPVIGFDSAARRRSLTNAFGGGGGSNSLTTPLHRPLTNISTVGLFDNDDDDDTYPYGCPNADEGSHANHSPTMMGGEGGIACSFSSSWLQSHHSFLPQQQLSESFGSGVSGGCGTRHASWTTTPTSTPTAYVTGSKRSPKRRPSSLLLMDNSSRNKSLRPSKPQPLHEVHTQRHPYHYPHPLHLHHYHRDNAYQNSRNSVESCSNYNNNPNNTIRSQSLPTTKAATPNNARGGRFEEEAPAHALPSFYFPPSSLSPSPSTTAAAVALGGGGGYHCSPPPSATLSAAALLLGKVATPLSLPKATATQHVVTWCRRSSSSRSTPLQPNNTTKGQPPLISPQQRRGRGVIWAQGEGEKEKEGVAEEEEEEGFAESVEVERNPQLQQHSHHSRPFDPYPFERSSSEIIDTTIALVATQPPLSSALGEEGAAGKGHTAASPDVSDKNKAMNPRLGSGCEGVSDATVGGKDDDVYGVSLQVLFNRSHNTPLVALVDSVEKETPCGTPARGRRGVGDDTLSASSANNNKNTNHSSITTDPHHQSHRSRSHNINGVCSAGENAGGSARSKYHNCSGGGGGGGFCHVAGGGGSATSLPSSTIHLFGGAGGPPLPLPPPSLLPSQQPIAATFRSSSEILKARGVLASSVVYSLSNSNSNNRIPSHNVSMHAADVGGGGVGGITLSSSSSHLRQIPLPLPFPISCCGGALPSSPPSTAARVSAYVSLPHSPHLTTATPSVAAAAAAAAANNTNNHSTVATLNTKTFSPLSESLASPPPPPPREAKDHKCFDDGSADAEESSPANPKWPSAKMGEEADEKRENKMPLHSPPSPHSPLPPAHASIPVAAGDGGSDHFYRLRYAAALRYISTLEKRMQLMAAAAAAEGWVCDGGGFHQDRMHYDWVEAEAAEGASNRGDAHAQMGSRAGWGKGWIDWVQRLASWFAVAAEEEREETNSLHSVEEERHEEEESDGEEGKSSEHAAAAHEGAAVVQKDTVINRDGNALINNNFTPQLSVLSNTDTVTLVTTASIADGDDDSDSRDGMATKRRRRRNGADDGANTIWGNNAHCDEELVHGEGGALPPPPPPLPPQLISATASILSHTSVFSSEAAKSSCHFGTSFRSSSSSSSSSSSHGCCAVSAPTIVGNTLLLLTDTHHNHHNHHQQEHQGSFCRGEGAVAVDDQGTRGCRGQSGWAEDAHHNKDVLHRCNSSQGNGMALSFFSAATVAVEAAPSPQHLNNGVVRSGTLHHVDHEENCGDENNKLIHNGVSSLASSSVPPPTIPLTHVSNSHSGATSHHSALSSMTVAAVEIGVGGGGEGEAQLHAPLSRAAGVLTKKGKAFAVRRLVALMIRVIASAVRRAWGRATTLAWGRLLLLQRTVAAMVERERAMYRPRQAIMHCEEKGR